MVVNLQLVAIAYAIGLVLSLAIERLLQPAPAFATRSKSAWLLHFGFWTLLFAFEFALFCRPFFASALALCTWFFLVLVNNAKWRALKEPFVASDFEYFADAIRHPRLYVPFFGWWRIVLSVAGVLGAISFGVWVEAPITSHLRADFWLMLALLVTAGMALVFVGAATRTPPSYEPVADLQRVGFIAFLFAYWRDEKPACAAPLNAAFDSIVAPPGDALLPHIVAVQSESFFDVRRWLTAIDPQILANWDQVVSASAQHGTLEVAAWGANTVRTEFAFLTGLANRALGIHRFNPYRRIAFTGVAALPSMLRKWGYHTVCIHPYAASFYGRDRVMPALGFDEFIDIKEFSANDYSGPYIGDAAVAEKIAARIGETKKPLFIFAITMENHGPLHLEAVRPSERNNYFSEARGDRPVLFPPDLVKRYDDLVIYLRHLINADKLVARVTGSLRTSARPGVFAMYGDHVPSMENVYGALGAPEGATDYLIWRSDAPSVTAKPTILKVEDLAVAVLRTAGLTIT